MVLLLLSQSMAATLTVAQDGTGMYSSIQAAINAAAGGDVVSINPGTYNEALNLNGKAITLNGASAEQVIIDGAGASNSVYLATGETSATVLQNLTIRNSGGGRGAYIYNTTPTLEGVVFESAGTTGTSLYGGALAVGGYYAAPTLTSCTFTANKADYGGHIILYEAATLNLVSTTLETGYATYYGGAIYVNNGTINATDTWLDGNSVEYYHGGAIYGENYAYLNFTGGGFTNNYMVNYTTYTSQGGAVLLTGSSALTADGTSFDANYAYYGGAIYGTYSTVTLTNTTLSDNFAYYGGAIYNYYTYGTTLTDVTASKNSCYYGGGFAYIYADSLLDVNSSSFEENLAYYYGYGGALMVYYVSGLDISDSTFNENQSYYDGAAAYVYQTYGPATISNTSFTSNEALYGSGGGVIIYYAASLQVKDSTFSDNTAYNNGGGLYIVYGPTNISNTTFTDNVATYYSAGGIYVTGDYYDDTLSISSTDLTNNEAGGDAGGLVVRGLVNVNLEDMRMTENESGGGGGAAFLSDNTTISGSNLHILGNTADYGGALFIADTYSSNAWHNNIFLNNQATYCGAICFQNNLGTSLINNALVGNEALDTASALYLYNNPIDMRNNAITHHSGAAAVYAYDTTSLDGSTFLYNDLYANAGGDVAGELNDAILPGTGNLAVDPLFVHYSDDGDVSNDMLVLLEQSPLVDAGDPALSDIDGSVSDIGAYGGSSVLVKDEDGDGVLNIRDCNDLDETMYPGASDVAYDGIDNDCGGGSDYDADGDGHDAMTYDGDDCDDDDAGVWECDDGTTPAGDTGGPQDTNAPKDVTEGEIGGGCGCQTTPAGLPALGALALGVLLVGRRRRAL